MTDSHEHSPRQLEPTGTDDLVEGSLSDDFFSEIDSYEVDDALSGGEEPFTTDPDRIISQKTLPTHEEDTLYAENFYRAVNNVQPEDLDDPKISKQYEQWLSTLTPHEVTNIEARKASRADYAANKERIAASTPRLLEGRLPDYQEQVLGEEHYVLGFNQSGTTSLEQATAYLKENNGISLGIYNLNQRFLFVDEKSTKEYPDNTERAVVSGYYGMPTVGRFVIAVPMDNFAKKKPRYNPEDASSAYWNIEDFTNPTESYEGESVNQKYIAGYIDGNGVYTANKNFAVSNILDFAELGAEA
ncbi:MAG: hypothetical protein JWN75_859 [Candidatus Saccharibacteria bacterium]|nr:hypothetical protein [Candidatus Saccharibacteria bacterium]